MSKSRPTPGELVDNELLHPDSLAGRILMAVGFWRDEMPSEAVKWFQDIARAAARQAPTPSTGLIPGEPFQARVQPWMLECFNAKIAADMIERCDRFIEEDFELVQALGYPRERIRALEEYTYNRPAGEPRQEVGGVMVTLAALCLAAGLDMHAAGETELARINTPETIAKIRAKQAAKPTGSALPIAGSGNQPGPSDELVERVAKTIYAKFEGCDMARAEEVWRQRFDDEIGPTRQAEIDEMRDIARAALAVIPSAEGEMNQDWAFLWKWVERGLFDPKISHQEALNVLAHWPGAPWKQGRWDVDHKPYAEAFYKKFPRARGDHMKEKRG